MSCISKEVVEDASENPIVDVLDSRDIVTQSAVLQVSSFFKNVMRRSRLLCI